jgi:hypothetical protein
VREANPAGTGAFNTEQHSIKADTLAKLATELGIEPKRRRRWPSTTPPPCRRGLTTR